MTPAPLTPEALDNLEALAAKAGEALEWLVYSDVEVDGVEHIVAACNAVPALIARIRELEEGRPSGEFRHTDPCSGCGGLAGECPPHQGCRYDP